MNRESAFTLIEILIALFIFTIITAIASSGLLAVLNARDQTFKFADQLAALQLTTTLMQRDITQIINRPITDGDGQRLPALLASTTNLNRLEFTRAGFSNPLAQFNRSSLQRVAYVLDDTTLYRVTWPVLDRAPNTSVERRQLLTHVKGLSIEFLNQQGQFTANWVSTNDPIQTKLPQGILITIILNNNSSIQRLLLLPEQTLETT